MLQTRFFAVFTSKAVRAWLIASVSIIPFLYISYQIYRVQSGDWQALGPEPGRTIVFFTGSWATYFLVATLLVTSLHRSTGWGWMVGHRRMIGLYCFFYACCHLLAYFIFLLEWDFQELANELVERRYLLFGMLAWVLLLPLAITSTKGWMKRLGKNWKKTHRLIYLLSLFVCIHYLLQIRSNWLEPVLWSGILMLLLLHRLWISRRRLTF